MRPMNDPNKHALFSDLVTRHRSELYGYIFAVVRRWEDADDLFQSVCLVLWSKFDSFQPGSNFFAWARQTAKNKVADFLRRRQQPYFVDGDSLDVLTEIAVNVGNDVEDSFLAALRHCREKLTVSDEAMLELHYGKDLGSRQIADQLQRSQPSVCRSLNRIRNWLLECVRLEIVRQEHVEDDHQ